MVVDCGGGGGDEAGVSEGAEIFRGVEAEGGGVAEGSGGRAVPGGSEGLGGVFDEEEVVALLEGGEGVPVGALAVEVDGQDGLDLGAAGASRRSSSTAAAERLKVAGSMSARRGWAPQRRMALTEAKKLKGVVMTASPGPMSGGGQASQRASVPLAQPMAWGTAQAAAAACSKLATWGPRMKCCEAQTASMAASNSCRIAANWREKSSIGTGCGLLIGTSVMVYRWWTGSRLSLCLGVRLTGLDSCSRCLVGDA